MRITTAAALGIFMVGSLMAMDHARATIKHYRLNIPRQPLDAALKDLADQTGLQIGRMTDKIDGSALVGPVRGNQTPEQALSVLLAGADLEYHIVGDNLVAIVDAGQSPADTPSERTPGEKSNSPRSATTGSVAPSATAHGQSSPDSAETAPRLTLSEVTVTAEKRNERLQDTPVPVTSISADSLIAQGQTRLEDYFASIPGLSLTTRGNGTINVSIRGITTGSGFVNPTVGIIVDDAPFGSSTALGSFENGAPEIDPSDIARIEVLRGPQGTLYGASSLGGLIKYVTQDPSTQALTGTVQTGVSRTAHSAGTGYAVRGSVNVPVTDDFAFRASAYSTEDPGYINNPLDGAKDINTAHSYGGRLATLWRISPDWTLRVSGIAEELHQNGSSAGALQAGFGDLEQPSTVRNAGGFEREVRSVVASATGRFGNVDVVAVSSYGNNHYQGTQDFSFLYGDVAAATFGVNAAYAQQNERTRKVTEELRLSGSVFTHLDWLTGFYYNHEQNTGQDFYYASLTTSQKTGSLEDDIYPSTFQEVAAYGDLTYHFTDAFNVQAGVRVSGNQQHYRETIDGPLYDPPAIQPLITSHDTAVTYLVTPQYTISPDLMVYSRIATGYRPGGPNSTCQLVNAPCSYEPDKTQNYEIGAKGYLFDHLLSFDMSVYDIEWKDIQLSVITANGEAYFANGSTAASRGVELSLDLHPARGTTLSGWATYDNAKLTRDLPANAQVQARKGDRLPYTAPWSAHLSINQDFQITSATVFYVGANASYMGGRASTLAPVGYSTLAELPGYTQVNLQLGSRFSAWDVGLYANNITDARGQLSNFHLFSLAGITTAVDYIRPLTVGLNVKRRF